MKTVSIVFLAFNEAFNGTLLEHIWRRIPIHEMPVSFRPRSVIEDKKIRPKFITVWTLLRFRWQEK